MGLKGGVLLLFPLAVLVMMILLQASSSANASLNGSSNVSFCQKQGCPTNSEGLTYQCTSLVPCKILPNCPPNLPPPAWCFPWPVNLIPSNQGAFLNPGTSVYIPAATIAAGQQTGSAIFGFSVSGAQGYTLALIVGIAVAVLAGLTILGSGVNQESIHILFVGGMLLGIWFILAGIEGFIFGNSASTFSQINAAVPNGGSFIFVMLTLMWTMGTMGAISRGGSV